MFTTIRALRISPAQQSKVTQVSTFMKKVVPGFTEDTLIPIFMIGVSNGEADLDWVQGRSSCHTTSAVEIGVLDMLRKAQPDNLWRTTKGNKEEKRKVLTALYSMAFNASPVNPVHDTPAYAWFRSVAVTPEVGQTATGTVTGRVSSAVETASAMPKAEKPMLTKSASQHSVNPNVPVKSTTATGWPAAKKVATPTQVKAAAKAKAPAAPVYLDNKGKPVAKAVIDRAARLNAVATSKDKRSQIIEGLGVTFADILIALAQQNKLAMASAEAMIVKFK